MLPSQSLSIASSQRSTAPGLMAGSPSLQSPHALPAGTVQPPPHTTYPSPSPSGQSAALTGPA
jgi:hypothetical protein